MHPTGATTRARAIIVFAFLIAGAPMAQAKQARPARNATQAEAVDPNASVAKAHGGKVWIQSQAFPSQEGDRLRDYLASAPANAELRQRAKDGPWPINFMAVFKKPSVKGAMTVQFFEKTDARAIVDQSSIENATAGLVYQAAFDLEPDAGFNKGHTYVIKVGQILKGKFVPYASGAFSLK